MKLQNGSSEKDLNVVEHVAMLAYVGETGPYNYCKNKRFAREWLRKARKCQIHAAVQSFMHPALSGEERRTEYIEYIKLSSLRIAFQQFLPSVTLILGLIPSSRKC